MNYEARQKLCERRLKLMKALPIMLREISQLEEENQDQIVLYINQKSEFTVSIHMLIDQIDSVLKRDDECQEMRGFHAVKTPKFYPSSEQLWAEMPVDIIKTAAEEHEECMKSLDDVRAQRQTKHIGVRKMSKSKGEKEISSTASAFQKVTPTMNEDCKASPVLKEKGVRKL